MKRWEYMSIDLELQDEEGERLDHGLDLVHLSTQLNELGRDGWELVSTVSRTIGTSDTGYNTLIIHTLKRGV